MQLSILIQKMELITERMKANGTNHLVTSFCTHMANRVNGRNAKARVSRGANEAMNLKRQEKNYLKTGPKRLRGSNGREYSQWVEAGDKIPHLVKAKDYIGSQECVRYRNQKSVLFMIMI